MGKGIIMGASGTDTGHTNEFYKELEGMMPLTNSKEEITIVCDLALQVKDINYIFTLDYGGETFRYKNDFALPANGDIDFCEITINENFFTLYVQAINIANANSNRCIVSFWTDRGQSGLIFGNIRIKYQLENKNLIEWF